MIQRETFNKLRNQNSNNSVSIYIPTKLTGDYEANRIYWKNACSEAIKTLEEKGVENTSFMQPAMDLLDTTDFWAHQSVGLAGFYSENHSSYHHLLNKTEPLTIVGDSFHVSPILQEIINEDRIFILALSQKEVRFFEAVNSGIYPVKISDVVPANMEKALYLDIDGNSLQSHSAGGSAQYHGNDSGQDKENIRLKQYFRAVDDGLMQFIHDERVPLVLAAVEEYYPMYKEITNYKYFSEHMITGNPENLSPTDLRKQVDPVFRDIHSKRVHKFVNNYNEKSQESLTIDGMEDATKFAENKNVDSMLVCQGYWENMNKDEKKQFDKLLLSIYDQGGDIVITDSEDHDCETIHAVKRY